MIRLHQEKCASAGNFIIRVPVSAADYWSRGGDVVLLAARQSWFGLALIGGFFGSANCFVPFSALADFWPTH